MKIEVVSLHFSGPSLPFVIHIGDYYLSGDLAPAWVPDEGPEALRDLMRAREAAKLVLLVRLWPMMTARTWPSLSLSSKSRPCKIRHAHDGKERRRHAAKSMPAGMSARRRRPIDQIEAAQIITRYSRVLVRRATDFSSSAQCSTFSDRVLAEDLRSMWFKKPGR